MSTNDHETQASINAWQRETFPNATITGVLCHLREEFNEFSNAAADSIFIKGHGPMQAAVEAADIVIILYCWAMLNGIDLHQVINEKMAVNRQRGWNIKPDGTGRHK